MAWPAPISPCAWLAVAAAIAGLRVFVVFAALLTALRPAVWWLVPDHHGNW